MYVGNGIGITPYYSGTKILYFGYSLDTTDPYETSAERRAVVYLNANTIALSGSGTSGDPIIIGLSE